MSDTSHAASQPNPEMAPKSPAEAVPLRGGLLHDLNNLLGVVIGNLDLLRERLGEDAASDELANEALTAALRSADLTGQLLAAERRRLPSPTPADGASPATPGSRP